MILGFSDDLLDRFLLVVSQDKDEKFHGSFLLKQRILVNDRRLQHTACRRPGV